MFLSRPTVTLVYDYDKDELLVHSQFATRKQVPVLVLLQVLFDASIAKNSQCMIYAEDQPLLRRPFYLKMKKLRNVNESLSKYE